MTLDQTPPSKSAPCRLTDYRRKDMFYLTTHSTHFYLRLYDVGHMVKDHSDSERGNPLPPHGLLFPISSKVVFLYASSHIPQPLLHQSWRTGWNKKWLSGSTMRDRPGDPSHHTRTLLPRSYISLRLTRD